MYILMPVFPAESEGVKVFRNMVYRNRSILPSSIVHTVSSQVQVLYDVEGYTSFQSLW